MQMADNAPERKNGDNEKPPAQGAEKRMKVTQVCPSVLKHLLLNEINMLFLLFQWKPVALWGWGNLIIFNYF